MMAKYIFEVDLYFSLGTVTGMPQVKIQEIVPLIKQQKYFFQIIKAPCIKGLISF